MFTFWATERNIKRESDQDGTGQALSRHFPQLELEGGAGRGFHDVMNLGNPDLL